MSSRESRAIARGSAQERSHSKQRDPPNLSEGVNVVVCGSDASLKSSVSELILMDRRSACVRTDVDPHARLIGLQDLPALVQLSEQEVMRAALRCVSLCHPGVHLFLLIIPDAPLNNEDRAEMEAIQRIFSSRIHRHMMILIKQSSERQTAQLDEETQAVLQSFGGRHHFIGPDTHVSTLMEKIEETLEENGGDVYSTETFLETQMEKLIKYEQMKKRIDSVETHLLPQGSAENEDDLRIVLLGKTGVGKSATGNTILGRDAFTAETSQESVTRESQSESSEVNGRRVTVIDTPGLFDTELSDEEIRREITHCISMILPGPHVFIIVLNLGQRFTKHEEESVKIIQEMFGKNSLMFTMVLFTRGDDLKDKTLEQCLGKPKSSIRKLTEACGHRVHVFNNNQTGDTTQVQELLEKIDNMLEDNGGSFYSCKMFREMERERQMKILMDRDREREEEMKIMMDRDREREEEMKKHEEEKERMKRMMEEERQNQEDKRKRREEELKREMREEEKHQREIRDEMRRERETFRHEMEEMRREKEKIKREDNLKSEYKTEIERLMNRMKNEKQNKEIERKRQENVFNKKEEQYKRLLKENEEEKERNDGEKMRREYLFREREERYKTLMEEKEEREEQMCEEMKREREKQTLEEKTRREEEEEKRREDERLRQEKIPSVATITSDRERLTTLIPDRRENTYMKTKGSLPNRRIVILGKSGVGKSASGNTILGRREFRSETRIRSVTRVCSEAQATVSGRSVSVVDTPGFFDTQMRPEDFVTEISRSVYLSSPGPHAFLIVFPVNMRFTEQEQQILKQIELLFGQDVFKYSIILFTHGDLLKEKTVEKLIEENSRLRDLVQHCRGRCHVLSNEDVNNRDQVNDLLQKIDSMVEQNGGGHYSHQMMEEAQKVKAQRESVCVCS